MAASTDDVLWLDDLTEGRRQAAAERRILFVAVERIPGCEACEQMDAETFSHPDVRPWLLEVIPVRFNTVGATRSMRRQLHELRQWWTPLFVWLDHHGIELRRQYGFLGPGAFQAEMAFTLAAAELLHGKAASASAAFRRVAETWPATATAPEALYWAGAAAFRAGADHTAIWHELRDRFPDSTWSQRCAHLAHTTVRRPRGAEG